MKNYTVTLTESQIETVAMALGLYKQRPGGQDRGEMEAILVLLDGAPEATDAEWLQERSERLAVLENGDTQFPVNTPTCECGKPGEWRGSRTGRRVFSCADHAE